MPRDPPPPSDHGCTPSQYQNLSKWVNFYERQTILGSPLLFYSNETLWECALFTFTIHNRRLLDGLLDLCFSAVDKRITVTFYLKWFCDETAERSHSEINVFLNVFTIDRAWKKCFRAEVLKRYKMYWKERNNWKVSISILIFVRVVFFLKSTVEVASKDGCQTIFCLFLYIKFRSF